MRIYITDGQVPELAPLKPQARRFLRQCAFQEMLKEHPVLRWIPTGLCAFGALAGLFTFELLPASFYSWADDAAQMFIPTGYILVLALLGGLIGSQILTHRVRHYIKRLLDVGG